MCMQLLQSPPPLPFDADISMQQAIIKRVLSGEHSVWADLALLSARGLQCLPCQKTSLFRKKPAILLGAPN